MNRSLLLPFLFLFTAVTAQEHLFNTESLEVNQLELEAGTYSKDSTANAFYIFEDGYSRFASENDYNLLHDYAAKIKILNKEGLDYANVKIRLHKGSRGKEKLHNLKATTYYLEDGIKKVQHLSPDKVYTEENPEYDVVKFTFPGVVPGAVVVYSYEKETPYFFKLETWWFQASIPKMHSRYKAEIPGNYRYHVKMVGTLKLDSEENDIKKRCFRIEGVPNPADCARSVFSMRNIPAFKEEKYMTSKYNFISRIEYELNEVISTDGSKKKYTRTWEDVDKELRSDNDLGKQLRKTKWVTGVLPAEISQLANNKEKAQKIYNFVKDNYKWDGEYHIFKDVSIKDLLERKTGNISAINILLHNLYKEEGFKVLPVLSSTRANGTPTRLYPVLTEFNYLLVQLNLNEEKFLLDATEKNAGFGLIPFRTLNNAGRLLDFEKESSWVNLEPSDYSQVVFRDSLFLDKSGITKGRSSHVFSGYHALRVRNDLDNTSAEDIFSLATPNDHTRSTSATSKNKEALSEELILEFDLENASQKINDMIYVNPFSFKFFDENPFKLKERTYPIDFGYKDAYSYSISLKLPEDHEIVELPERKFISLPEGGGSLQFLTQKVDETTVNIYCRVSFSKSLYGAGFYPYLQQFMATLIDLQENTLILVKKKTT